MSRSKHSGRILVTCLGEENEGHKLLLSAICKAGVVLTNIETVKIGIFATNISYSVEGSEAQVELFAQLVDRQSN